MATRRLAGIPVRPGCNKRFTIPILGRSWLYDSDIEDLTGNNQNSGSNYYEAIKQAQRSNEITSWIKYFVKTILEAQEQTKAYIDFIMQKANFFDQYDTRLNERQTKAINKMLQQWPDTFEGGMSAKKYMNITKTSKPTATRDLQLLVEMGISIPAGGGRSTRYDLEISQK